LELTINKYILFISQLLSLTPEDYAHFFAQSTQKTTYNWWQRLWRIYKFLKRKKRQKKQEKQKRKHQKKQNKRFNRRKRWRKFKVVIRSLFRIKRSSPEERALKQRKAFLRRWKKRRRRRLFWVFVKSLAKPKNMSKARLKQKDKDKKEKAFRKYRKRRIYRFIIKRNIRIIWDVLSGKGLPKRRQRGPSLWLQIWQPKQLNITINSLMFFLLSYFFIAFFDKLSMAFTSLLFDYKTVIYYYKIEFLVDNDAWYGDSIKTIFASGPIVGLLIAVLSLIVYSIVYLETGLLKTLFLWTIFHGFNRIINGALIGSMLGKGFGYVISYLYYSDTGKLILSLLMILFSIIIGTTSTKYWIITANSYYNFSKQRNRQLYIYSQVLLPFILGNIIIYIVNIPKVVFYDTLVNAFMFFMILPILLLNKHEQDLYFDESPKRIKLSIRLLLFTLLFIGTYRILLDYGLRIG